MSGTFWLSEEQFNKIKPLLPNKPRGVPRVDDRKVLSLRVASALFSIGSRIWRQTETGSNSSDSTLQRVQVRCSFSRCPWVFRPPHERKTSNTRFDNNSFCCTDPGSAAETKPRRFQFRLLIPMRTAIPRLRHL